MRICYIAKHGAHDNRDEEAISYAFQQLGHEVFHVSEAEFSRRPCPEVLQGDLCLFHKLDMRPGFTTTRLEDVLKQIKMPKVFWYFDKVEFPDDPHLESRAEVRRNWMKAAMSEAFGFCTDGDWVTKHPDRLYHLMQGADERFTGRGLGHMGHPLLFTGMIAHGRIREQQIARLREKYGDDFEILGSGGAHGRLHGRPLANKIASAEICIAPLGPSSDQYWSNRVYLTLGMGGFLLHPACAKLRLHYTDRQHLVTYRDFDECESLIEMYRGSDPGTVAARDAIAQQGYRETMGRHLYRHRVEALIEVCKLKGIIK